MWKDPRWDDKELKVLTEHYSTASKEYIGYLLPKRKWSAIRCKANRMGHTRIELDIKKETRTKDGPGKILLGTATEADIAYTAGFIDGEGSLVMSTRRPNKNKVYNIYPLLKACNTDEESIKYMKSIIGGVITSNLSGTYNRKITIYNVIVGGTKQLYRVIKALRPYLIVKTRRADLMIKFLELRMSKPYASPYEAEEIEIYNEFHKGSLRWKNRDMPTPC